MATWLSEKIGNVTPQNFFVPNKISKFSPSYFPLSLRILDYWQHHFPKKSNFFYTNQNFQIFPHPLLSNPVLPHSLRIHDYCCFSQHETHFAFPFPTRRSSTRSLVLVLWRRKLDQTSRARCFTYCGWSAFCLLVRPYFHYILAPSKRFVSVGSSPGMGQLLLPGLSR